MTEYARLELAIIRSHKTLAEKLEALALLNIISAIMQPSEGIHPSVAAPVLFEHSLWVAKSDGVELDEQVAMANFHEQFPDLVKRASKAVESSWDTRPEATGDVHGNQTD